MHNVKFQILDGSLAQEPIFCGGGQIVPTACFVNGLGHVMQDIPKASSPLYTVKALIPVIDTNGFKADLQTATQGQAFCLQVFDHWSIVPGQALACDLVLKMWQCKGLGDQIAVSKYLDDEFVLALSLSASGHADLLGYCTCVAYVCKVVSIDLVI
ncbi:hypothetical protein BD769DRAFT_1389472 [Suillus cothurnatus]|nr:hypothetical protein BD769DRAFT_1389472 [Suillus cothurnatus]